MPLPPGASSRGEEHLRGHIFLIAVFNFHIFIIFATNSVL